ncbi:MAG: DUF1080 domain-containing protein [Sedimentisphaerales bacterium]
MMGTKYTIITDTLFHSASFLRHTALRNLLYTTLLLGFLTLGACRRSSLPASPAESNAAGELTQTEISLFDGETLGQWKITDFGGQGDVYVKDGAIFLEMGNDLTGITWAGPLVRMNYEISLEAMRVTGNDFFCGLTFPVDANCCSLILGGWGGSVCGLSSLDYYDAADNETTQIIDFEKGRWYRVRLRVTPAKIEAWLDEEKIVDVDTAGRIIDTRIEVEPSKPLGIATWQTTGAVRNIQLRRLNPAPIEPVSRRPTSKKAGLSSQDNWCGALNI